MGRKPAPRKLVSLRQGTVQILEKYDGADPNDKILTMNGIIEGMERAASVAGKGAGSHVGAEPLPSSRKPSG
jgi:hypothetical protein